MLSPRRRAVGLVLGLALAIFGRPASADPAQQALWALFANGDYIEAAQRAETAAGADDFAFAARSLLADCMTREVEPDHVLLDRAAEDARHALRLNPLHEDGRLELAIALSLKSRTMTLADAWIAGYGEEGRRLAEGVIAADPGNFYASGFLAVWNLEVRRRGGRLGASLLGASIEAGRRLYGEAASRAPLDVGIHWQFARALAALDAVRYGDEAAQILDRALAAPAHDHVQAVMQARAGELAAALKGDRRHAERRAREML